MARSHSILRRYTPPTCTLEVMAKESALSRWAVQPVVKDIRFQLSLDDPTLPKEEWVVVKGDRNQLAALGDAVSTYVQSLLAESSDHISLVSVRPDTDAPLSVPGKLHETVATLAQPTSGITLQSKGLLKHELHWGELATAETGPITRLSTLQLFDLANALDDYAGDVLDLPQRSSTGWVKSFPNWAQVAAVVLVAVGLSTSAIRLFDGSAPMTAVAPTTSQGASSSDQKIATQLPPQVVEKATPPVISDQKLPPPPPIGATPAKPGLPTVITPKQPSPSPAPGTVSPNVIAAYPVPVVPGAPTIIQGEPRTTVAPPPLARPAPIPPSSTMATGPVNEPNAAIAAKRGAIADERAANSTAFDTIPQVAEVRNYFQQKWKPPEGLTQILEYSLRLNADGTIENISPLRQASGDYIDRTGMPLLGDPFVSPLKGRQSAKIRVVLEPNGQVRTFLEE